jgi:hypothetical protein
MIIPSGMLERLVHVSPTYDHDLYPKTCISPNSYRLDGRWTVLPEQSRITLYNYQTRRHHSAIRPCESCKSYSIFLCIDVTKRLAIVDSCYLFFVLLHPLLPLRDFVSQPSYA